MGFTRHAFVRHGTPCPTSFRHPRCPPDGRASHQRQNSCRLSARAVTVSISCPFQLNIDHAAVNAGKPSGIVMESAFTHRNRFGGNTVPHAHPRPKLVRQPFGAIACISVRIMESEPGIPACGDDCRTSPARAIGSRCSFQRDNFTVNIKTVHSINSQCEDLEATARMARVGEHSSATSTFAQFTDIRHHRIHGICISSRRVARTNPASKSWQLPARLNRIPSDNAATKRRRLVFFCTEFLSSLISLIRKSYFIYERKH